jgi:hypothetical protein
MTRFLICLAPLLVIASPAFAQQASTDTVATPAPAAVPAKPKKICRTQQITGRRISQTQCYTAAQWAEYDRMNNEDAKQFVNTVSGLAGRSTLQSSADGGLSTSSVFGLGPPQ